jgi:hypothetical protein
MAEEEATSAEGGKDAEEAEGEAAGEGAEGAWP